MAERRWEILEPMIRACLAGTFKQTEAEARETLREVMDELEGTRAELEEARERADNAEQACSEYESASEQWKRMYYERKTQRDRLAGQAEVLRVTVEEAIHTLETMDERRTAGSQT